MNNPLTYTDPTGNCWGKFRNTAPCVAARQAIQNVRQSAIDAGQAVAQLAVDTGHLIAKANQIASEVQTAEAQGYLDAGPAAIEGGQRVVGIEEVYPVTVQIGGQEVTYSNVVAQKSGLDLVNTVITLVGGGANAIAIGGPIGVVSRDPLPAPLMVHEGQHIMEQEYVGTLTWHAMYQTEYWLGVIEYGDTDTAYRYHSAENRARHAAGQPTYWPSWGGSDNAD